MLAEDSGTPTCLCSERALCYLWRLQRGFLPGNVVTFCHNSRTGNSLRMGGGSGNKIKKWELPLKWPAIRILTS